MFELWDKITQIKYNIIWERIIPRNIHIVIPEYYLNFWLALMIPPGYVNPITYRKMYHLNVFFQILYLNQLLQL